VSWGKGNRLELGSMGVVKCCSVPRPSVDSLAPTGFSQRVIGVRTDLKS